MIGILIVTNGNLGDALIDAAAQVLGKPLERVRSLPVNVDDNPDTLLERARSLAHEIDAGQGVLLL